MRERPSARGRERPRGQREGEATGEREGETEMPEGERERLQARGEAKSRK